MKLLSVFHSSGQFRHLNTVEMSTLSQADVEVLINLGENKGLRLSAFICPSISFDILRPDGLERFLSSQNGSLKKCLQLGCTTAHEENRIVPLNINLSQYFPQLEVLILKLSPKIRVKTINFGESFPRLKKLSITFKEPTTIQAAGGLHFEDNIYYLEDLIQVRTENTFLISAHFMYIFNLHRLHHRHLP